MLESANQNVFKSYGFQRLCRLALLLFFVVVVFFAVGGIYICHLDPRAPNQTKGIKTPHVSLYKPQQRS